MVMLGRTRYAVGQACLLFERCLLICRTLPLMLKAPMACRTGCLRMS